MTALRLDATYYAAARRCLERARQVEPKVADLLQHFAKLCAREENIRNRHRGGVEAHYDRLESIWIQMEGIYESLSFAYGPLLEALASTHILCVAALESHINARAAEFLTGRMHDRFETADLEFKWLSFPKLLGKEGFDPGASPFQDLTRLIKFRNALVHYRKRREPWKYPGVPSFLGNLGLTLGDSTRSVECVRRMMSALAERLGEKVPHWHWLRREDAEVRAFDIEFPEPDKNDAPRGAAVP